MRQVKVRTIRPDVFIGSRTWPLGSVLELPADRAAAEVRAGVVAFHDWPSRVLEVLSRLVLKAKP